MRAYACVRGTEVVSPSGVNFPAKNDVMVVRVRMSVRVRTEGVLRNFIGW